MRLLLIGLLLLSGCAEGIDRAKTYSDKAGRAALQGPCAMTLGAYTRLPQVKAEVVGNYATVICPR